MFLSYASCRGDQSTLTTLTAQASAASGDVMSDMCLEDAVVVLVHKGLVL